MAEDAARSRLGRGLAALIGDVDVEAQGGERRNQRRAPIEFLKPNPRNPRRDFSEAELEELTQSLRERGMIQPIVVRHVPGASDSYEIIAGERRWLRVRSTLCVSSSPISAARPRPNRDRAASSAIPAPPQLARNSFSRWMISVASRK